MQQLLKLIQCHKNIFIALSVFFIVCINQWIVQYQYFIWFDFLLTISIALIFYIFGSLALWAFGPEAKTVKQNMMLGLSYLFIWFGYAILLGCIVVFGQRDLPLTPNPLIDPFLHEVDQLFGFNEAKVMTYFHQNLSYLMPYIEWVYFHLNTEVMITLVLLPIFCWKRFTQIFRIFFILMGFTIIFYYFFPSMGPANYYSGYNFDLALVNQLIDYHALKLDHTLPPVLGAVAAPSWHVLCGLIFIYGWWPVKRFGLRYIALIFNSLLILSIFPLGQHFLADLLMSFTLFGIMYALESGLLKKAILNLGSINILSAKYPEVESNFELGK